MPYPQIDRTRRPPGHPKACLVAVLVVAGCGQSGPDSAHESSAFATDTAISGVVLENVTACEVDGACYLRIEFADTIVVALYGAGERPDPPCTIPVEVSDAAFLIRPPEVIDAVISTCGAEGYYLRRVVRASG